MGMRYDNAGADLGSQLAGTYLSDVSGTCFESCPGPQKIRRHIRTVHELPRLDRYAVDQVVYDEVPTVQEYRHQIHDMVVNERCPVGGAPTHKCTDPKTGAPCPCPQQNVAITIHDYD